MIVTKIFRLVYDEYEENQLTDSKLQCILELSGVIDADNIKEIELIDTNVEYEDAWNAIREDEEIKTVIFGEEEEK